MLVAELSIIPLAGEEMRPFIDAAIAIVRESGLKYEVGALGTTLEGELDDILRVAKEAHQAAVQRGAGRVVTELRLDERSGSNVTIDRETRTYREDQLNRRQA